MLRLKRNISVRKVIVIQNFIEFHVPPPQSRKPKLVRSGDGNGMILGIEVELKRVGEIPEPMVFTNGHKSSEEFDKSFPTFITAGDISKDGSQIILRGKDGMNIMGYGL